MRGEIFGSTLLVFSGQASGRFFGSQCAETGKLAATSWEFATPISELAARVRHLVTGGHAHVPGTTDFEMLRHLCSAVITSGLRLRDRRASELQVFTINDESEDGEARDLLSRRHPSTQTTLTREQLNLGHPKSNVSIRQLSHAAHASQQSLKAL